MLLHGLGDRQDLAGLPCLYQDGELRNIEYLVVVARLGAAPSQPPHLGVTVIQDSASADTATQLLGWVQGSSDKPRRVHAPFPIAAAAGKITWSRAQQRPGPLLASASDSLVRGVVSRHAAVQ